MVSNLIWSLTRALLLDERYADAFEPYNESRIPGSTMLDEFIAKDFRVMCVVGDFRVMIRTSAGGPVPACPGPVTQP